jgi:glycosyltransferase involved in cell wall biosynthesis
MRVTVAICTWNRCSELARTLEQMTRLHVPADVEWELLVVNNNCTDATDEIIKSMSNRLPIRRLFEPVPGKTRALNLTLSEAKGDFIVWTDDDVLVDEMWLEAFLETARRYPSATVFGGPIEPCFAVPPDPKLMAAFPALASGFCGLDHLAPEGPLAAGLYVWGANIACRKAGLGSLTFAECLGPRASLHMGGDDKEFIDRVRKTGGEVVWSPGMRVRHSVQASRMTLAYLTSHCEAQGRTFIRESGIPEGARVWGVPRWLWRKCLESWVRYACHRLTPWATNRLVELRRFTFWRGAVSECRLISRGLTRSGPPDLASRTAPQ